MAYPAEADVIRTVQRDAVPGQRAIGSGELATARASVGVFSCSLMSTVASWPTAKLIPLRASSANPCFAARISKRPAVQARRLIVPRAVGCDRARRTCVDVLDCHRDIAKGYRRLGLSPLRKRLLQFGPMRGTPPLQATEAARRVGPGRNWTRAYNLQMRIGQTEEELRSVYDIRLQYQLQFSSVRIGLCVLRKRASAIDRAAACL